MNQILIRKGEEIMADFTINSLSKTGPASTDSFVKSNTEGGLTRTTMEDVKKAAIGNNDISSIGDGSVTGAICALNDAKITFKVVEFSQSDFSQQNGGWAAYKNIASIAPSAFPVTAFVSRVDGIYNSCCVSYKGIDTNTMYLCVKSFDTVAPTGTTKVIVGFATHAIV